MTVRTGLEMLAADRFRLCRGDRVGAICNPTTVDARLRHLADHLAEAPDLKLRALFGPEHGVRGDVQDMVGVESDVDSRTGVVVHSLYGAEESSLTPRPEQLDGLDLLIFDIQDVGSRYYTFAATMLHAMRAAAASGVRFVVLDRPNPIGGALIEGPLVQPGYESFVGAYPTPIRHGMTLGELARMFHRELALDLDLEVVPCVGWHRDMLWTDTELPWVSPSPNMPSPDTALVYPGGCLIEGTNLSEGRGTTRPFEYWGAPWLDGNSLARPFRAHEAVLPRPCAFRPMFHKHAGALCQGVQPHPSSPRTFRSVSLYAAFLSLAREQDTGRFAWRTEPYEFLREPIAIDLLFGSPRERSMIEQGAGLADDQPWRVFEDVWKEAERDFAERRRTFLLYD